MGNKYMNIRELQIETMRYHCTPTTGAKTCCTDNIKRCQGCGATGTLSRYLWECKRHGHFLRNQTLTPHNPAIALLGIYPKEGKA